MNFVLWYIDMDKRKIFISPSNQNANIYAWGNTNEAEQCGKIGNAVKTALERCGFAVKLEQWETMQKRVADSDSWGADMHLAIHTNASVNHTAGGTQVFFYAYNGYGNIACQKVFDELKGYTPGSNAEVCRRYSALYEVNKPNATSVYCEVEFHDVAEYAKWIVEHTSLIAECICKGICKYYNYDYVPPKETMYYVQCGAFKDRKNAEELAERLKKDGYSVYIKEV